MPGDNGAINQGASNAGSCSPCNESPAVQCGVEENSVACSTPSCDPKLATLPKATSGKLILRRGECRYDNPTIPAGVSKVWVRGVDGMDKLCDLTPDMIPAQGNKPCFRTVEEAAADTFGLLLLAQVDTDTGKTCLNKVPLEDTNEAYLAGFRTPDACSGDSEVRPVRIIPEDIEGCPDNIRILAATEVEEEVQPGLKKLRTIWNWLKSITLTDANLQSRDGTEEDAACVLPAAWVKNGDCSTLVKLQLEDGVLGAWAYCGNCLRFYELPSTGDGYESGVVLKYVGGTECWQWSGASGDQCYQAVEARPVISSSSTGGTKTCNLSAYDPPECAKFAIVSVTTTQCSSSGSSAAFTLAPYFTETVTANALAIVAPSSSCNNAAAWIEVPMFSETIKFSQTITGVATSRSVTIRLIGFR